MTVYPAIDFDSTIILEPDDSKLKSQNNMITELYLRPACTGGASNLVTYNGRFLADIMPLLGNPIKFLEILSFCNLFSP